MMVAPVQQAWIDFRETSAFCPFPLRFDTYQGCSFMCAYCFARNRRVPAYQRLIQIPKRLDNLKAQLEGKKPTLAIMAAKEGYTVMWGCLSDPFMALEAQTKTSLNALRLFHQHGLSFNVSTKGVLPASAEYIKELKRFGNKSQFRVSFSTLDDAKARILEPGAPPPSARLAALRKIRESGVPVVARLAPFFPAVTVKRPTVEEMAEVLAKLKPAAPYVSFLFLSVNPGLRNRVWLPLLGKLGLDGKAWMQSYCVQEGLNVNMRLPASEWLATAIINTKEAAKQVGIMVGFEWLPFTLGIEKTDGKFCCDAGADLKYNPDTMTVMYKEGRLKSMELQRPFPFPKKHYNTLCSLVQWHVKHAAEMAASGGAKGHARLDRKS